MTTKRVIIVLLTVFFVFAFVASSQEIKKMSKYGFKGETNDVVLIVDTETARLREAETFVPLFIYLNNSTKGTIKADRGSFTLVTPDGDRLSLPSYDEVTKGYGSDKIGNDYTYLKKIEDYASISFLSSKMIPRVCFFPNPSKGSVLYDKVELPNRSYFKTLLYFPNVAKNKSGTYTLIFEDQSSQIKVEVPFVIEWLKK
jgi:hypothetical protein